MANGNGTTVIGGGSKSFANIKKALGFILFGTMVYFAVKYWKWIKMGLGAYALVEAAPILAPILAGILEVAVGGLIFLVKYIKGRMAKGEEVGDTEAEIQDDIDATETITKETLNTAEGGSGLTGEVEPLTVDGKTMSDGQSMDTDGEGADVVGEDAGTLGEAVGSFKPVVGE